MNKFNILADDRKKFPYFYSEQQKGGGRGPLSCKDKNAAYAVLATVSSRYSSLPGRLSTCYSPVRHFTQAEATHVLQIISAHLDQ